MTEEKLDRRGQTATKRRLIGLVLAIFAVLTAALWLFRQPLLEAVGGSACRLQGLSCHFQLSRLDAGGVTLTGLDIRAAGSDEAAIRARELRIDLTWDTPFSPRASQVGGDDVVIRVDLTGRRALLGDLDEAFRNITKPTGAAPRPPPRLNFANLTLIGDTLSGPLEAKGQILARGEGGFIVKLRAPAAKLGLAGASIELAGGSLDVSVDGAQISVALDLDLSRFDALYARLADVRMSARLEQDAGVLKAQGEASLGSLRARGASLASSRASAVMEASPAGPAGLDLNALLLGLRRLQVDVSAGEGSVGSAGWNSARLTAQVQPRARGRSSGDISLALSDLKLPQAAISRFEVTGIVSVVEGVVSRASGAVSAASVRLSDPSRKQITDAISGHDGGLLPGFAGSAAAALDMATRDFSLSTKWQASLEGRTARLAVVSGADIRAASGLRIALFPLPGQSDLAAFDNRGSGQWTAAGSARMSGGGAPPIALDIRRATGSQGRVSLEGAANLAAWKVGSESIAASLEGFTFNLDRGSGTAKGRLNVGFDGNLAGGIWQGARASLAGSAAWDPNAFVLDAPQGVDIGWEEARFGETRVGAAALRYRPSGRFAATAGNRLVGRGVLASAKAPVAGGGWSARTELGAAGIEWSLRDSFRASLDMAPSRVEILVGQRPLSIRIPDLTGALDLREGWRLKGDFKGGRVDSDEAVLADLGGTFSVGGKGSELDGALTGVSVRIFDPKGESDRRYEEARFEGGASLHDGRAEFAGDVALVRSGVQIARITGQHDLKKNQGSLRFSPTPLVFSPRRFQPYDLSPLLRGPANVTGRVDISGGVSWNADGLQADAMADLSKVGFALASAGVFEGVNGRIEIADLLRMRSQPGQEITIDRITLGLPVEAGRIRFQLAGFDAIALEAAEWPFGGGYLRVKPMRFTFGPGDSNRIVAEAENWDLEKLVETFKLPDLRLKGVVSGEFPVVFTTGSARIDNAVLEANRDGGVIQYSGSAGDAAAQADENSKRLFDALKDFRYDVLKVGLNGDLAGRIVMMLNIYGRNPEVLAGSPFQLNIGIDSELVRLLQNASSIFDARAIVRPSTGDTP